MQSAEAIQTVLTRQRDKAINDAARAEAQVLVLEGHLAALEEQIATLTQALAAFQPPPQESPDGTA